MSPAFQRIIVVTPPTPDGKADAASLVAAEICGVDEVYVVGGMQAIAALAFGTETIPKVAKLIGPGSSYVSAAKRLLYGTVDVGLARWSQRIDHFDGRNADPVSLRSICWSKPNTARNRQRSSSRTAESRPAGIGNSAGLYRRTARMAASVRQQRVVELRRHLLTNSLEESIQFVNDYAPEHLEVLTREPFVTLGKLKNAGEILLGHYTPIPTANYCLGLNAILPTGGFARSFSSVSVWDFLKRSGVGYLSQEGYQRLQGITATLADYEDFPAHAMAIRKRNQILGL